MEKHFRAIKGAELDWEDAQELFDLPAGVKIKMLSEDPYTGRRDFLCSFPPGYVEPEHRHSGHHSVLILEGTMLVDGKRLGQGDYVFGPSEEDHGPMEYPEGIVLFGSFYGDTQHVT